ncbi:MAG: hypothetical protein ACLUOS_15475 [Odoribacter splanchnicus]
METNPQLELAFNFLEYTGTSIFLTGKAGTGKTTFLRELATFTKRICCRSYRCGRSMPGSYHSFIFSMPFGPYVRELKKTARVRNGLTINSDGKINIIGHGFAGHR